MPQLLIHLSDKEDKTVEIYKAEHSLDTKEQAVKKIIAEYEENRK